MSVFPILHIDRFGKCIRCMRGAMGTALAGIICLAIATILGAPGAFLGLAALVTALLMTNAALHVAAFTYRNSIHREGAFAARRSFLAGSARLAAIGLAASIPLAGLSTRALAFCGQCTKNDDCGVGFVCKNTAAVNEGKVCNECVEE